MDVTRRSALAGLSFWLVSPLSGLEPEEDLFPSKTLIRAARQQIGVTVSYDGAYRSIAYPGGDVPRNTGVCIDVVIRALRDGFGFDLQKAVHEDMRTSFSAYPDIWGLSRTDRNIDHRRVPNVETWLNRQGYELDPDHWCAGDIVSMRLRSSGLPHIAILSDKSGRDGKPLGIHNIGRGTQEETVLGRFEDYRRFRFFPRF